MNLNRFLRADKIHTGLLVLVSSAMTPLVIISGEEGNAGLAPLRSSGIRLKKISAAYIYRYFSRLDTMMLVRHPERVCGRVLPFLVKIIKEDKLW